MHTAQRSLLRDDTSRSGVRLSLSCGGGGRGAATIRTTHALSLLRMDPAQQTPNLLSLNLGKRWRAERNFWISFLCFTLWWCAAQPRAVSLRGSSVAGRAHARRRVSL